MEYEKIIPILGVYYFIIILWDQRILAQALFVSTKIIDWSADSSLTFIMLKSLL
jgi:hypothetical protein